MAGWGWSCRVLATDILAWFQTHMPGDRLYMDVFASCVFWKFLVMRSHDWATIASIPISLFHDIMVRTSAIKTLYPCWLFKVDLEYLRGGMGFGGDFLKYPIFFSFFNEKDSCYLVLTTSTLEMDVTATNSVFSFILFSFGGGGINATRLSLLN